MWQEIKKIIKHCSKKKGKSSSLENIQKITYTYDTSEDESEEEHKKQIENVAVTKTVANEDPVPDPGNAQHTDENLDVIPKQIL